MYMHMYVYIYIYIYVYICVRALSPFRGRPSVPRPGRVSALSIRVRH